MIRLPRCHMPLFAAAAFSFMPAPPRYIFSPFRHFFRFFAVYYFRSIFSLQRSHFADVYAAAIDACCRLRAIMLFRDA